MLQKREHVLMNARTKRKFIPLLQLLAVELESSNIDFQNANVFANSLMVFMRSDRSKCFYKCDGINTENTYALTFKPSITITKIRSLGAILKSFVELYL